MREPNEGRDKIRHYLLGDLNEEDRQQVEERIFTDREYRQEVLMVEEELLEEYASDELSDSERELFRLNYLSTQHQARKLRITRALNKYAADHAIPLPTLRAGPGWMRRFVSLARSRGRFTQIVFAGSLVVLLLTGAWLGWNAWRSMSRSAALGEELVQLNSPTSLAAAPDSTVVSATLKPIQLRDPNSRPITVQITPAIRVVRLQIPQVPKGYGSYRAVINGSDGSPIVTVSGLKPLSEHDTLTVQFPAKIFTNNDYLLAIYGVQATGQTDEIAGYQFSVQTNQ